MSGPRNEASDIPLEGGALRAEYERELGTWLRRRLGYLCIAYAIFQLLSTSALIVTSLGGLRPESAELPRAATPIEQRATQAERRADAGLPPRIGDERAIKLAHEIQASERAQEQREKSAQAVVSALDAFSAIAQDLTDEVKSGLFRRRPPRVDPPMVPADRWWLEAPAVPQAAPHRVVTQVDSPVGVPGTVGESGSDESTDMSTTHGALTLEGVGVAQRTASGETRDEASSSQRSQNSGNGFAEGPIPWWIFALFAPVMLGVVAWFGLHIRPRLFTRAELVAAASRMILILGLLNFMFESALMLAVPDAPATPLLSIFFWHLTASLFLPWSWRESLKPIAPLLGLWMLLSLGLAVPHNDWFTLLAKVIAVPFLFGPALILCYTRLQWHRNRFRNGFVGRRFLAMRREYQQARAVHESLFPKPVVTDWMRFDFGYRPAADIGGDFIHTWTGADGRFHLALIDVTGHGLASAMSVARIHGEIERLHDEYPNDGPAKLLLRLNRYFHRLLARHRLYATGIVLTIDPRRGELRYASAGHPPILLRSKGNVTELESTTFLLGAVEDALFGDEEVAVLLEERDTLILFTDGAYDAISPRGERFTLARLREIVARPVAPPQWTQFLMRLIETFEAGMAEDDLLVAEVTFLHRRSVSSVTGDAPPTSFAASVAVTSNSRDARVTADASAEMTASHAPEMAGSAE